LLEASRKFFGEIADGCGKRRVCRIVQLPGACDRLHALARMRVEMCREASTNLVYYLRRQGIEHPIGQGREQSNLVDKTQSGETRLID
jgi:hypothetical protein